jgi:hypothetical protein
MATSNLKLSEYLISRSFGKRKHTDMVQRPLPGFDFLKAGIATRQSFFPLNLK